MYTPGEMSRSWIGWEAPLGGIGPAPLADNLEAWSGDHCVASELVPGVLLCNRMLNTEQPSLIDIGPTLLQLCGIAPSAEMSGRSLIPSA